MITNSHFTKPATEFAKKLGVELINRVALGKLILEPNKIKN